MFTVVEFSMAICTKKCAFFALCKKFVVFLLVEPIARYGKQLLRSLFVVKFKSLDTAIVSAFRTATTKLLDEALLRFKGLPFSPCAFLLSYSRPIIISPLLAVVWVLLSPLPAVGAHPFQVALLPTAHGLSSPELSFLISESLLWPWVSTMTLGESPQTAPFIKLTEGRSASTSAAKNWVLLFFGSSRYEGTHQKHTITHFMYGSEAETFVIACQVGGI
ncbi:hypothetical protein LCGC14_2684380 [marine sediment metagenome]|uniref:Uncharacterized protein n=1 Tax=marine sediment metagenome TaxID=412755 RepID=A0A0F9CC39_9ZZZZ